MVQFISSRMNQQSTLQNQNLEFSGLNPLLARQLSQLEAQIGQFTQVRFEMAQERERMRFEMESLKNAIRNSQELPQNVASVPLANQ